MISDLGPIALIGTGLTGAPLARHLARVSHVVAWDRDHWKVAPLERDGVKAAGSAREAVAVAPIVVIDVLDDRALREVSEGSDGVLAGVQPGSMVLDITTTSLNTKKWLAGEVERKGARPVEAPFFGSVAEAEGGEIWTMVGCDDGDWPLARTVLELFSIPTRIGDMGEATRFKLAANVLTFSMVQLIAEAISLARALGVDPDLLLQVLAKGTGVRAPIYQVKGRAMIDGDFSPKATIELARKDLHLIVDAARRHGLGLPLTEMTQALFDRAAEAGWAGDDMARVFELLGGER